MTLKLDRSDCNRLAIACLTLQHSLEREAADDQTNADRREIAQRSAKMWERLHEAVRAQVDDFDRKQAERKSAKA